MISTRPPAALPESVESPPVTPVETGPAPILKLDQRGVIEHVNEAAEGLFGAGTSELAGRPLPTLLAEPFAAEYQAILRAVAAGEAHSMPGRARLVAGLLRDGTAVALELSLSEIRIGDDCSLIARVG